MKIKHNKNWIAFLCILLLLPSLLSCSLSGSQITGPQDSGKITSPAQSQQAQTDEPSTPTPTSTSTATAEDPVQKMLSDMTLEQKIGQMLYIAYRQNVEGQPALALDSTLEGLLEEIQPGGFVFFSENLDGIEQTTGFIQSLQQKSTVPLFIGIDEEGGIVSRLNKAPKLHSTQMPNSYTIGKTGKPLYAYEASKAIASEIGSLGFNMDFAPVADIYTNPANKVIGKRAFGSTPELVSSMVVDALNGFTDESIVPVLKHFPGHGDTEADTHSGAATVDHDWDRLMTTELVPFIAGIQSGADAIMIAHIILPNITEEDIPASLSKEIITDLLRSKLGFDGLVITDALEMKAVSSFFDEDEAVLRAVEAGDDMLLMPTDPQKAFETILNAVRQGRITEDRIDASVMRILRVKQKYGILTGNTETLHPDEVLGSEAHKNLADTISKEASPK